jgi:hypothetical protein
MRLEDIIKLGSRETNCRIRTGSEALSDILYQAYFYGQLLAPLPTPKREGDSLSVVRHCLFSIFAATRHIWRPSPPSAT